MKTITPTAVLDYYDGIQIFTAADEIGGNYLGAMVGTVGDHGRYLGDRSVTVQLAPVPVR